MAYMSFAYIYFYGKNTPFMTLLSLFIQIIFTPDMNHDSVKETLYLTGLLFICDVAILINIV